MRLNRISAAALIALSLSTIVIEKSYANNETDTNVTKIYEQQTRIYNGWSKNEHGTWNYYKSGIMVVDQWVKDSGKWYYLDVHGDMISNDSYLVGNKIYTFDYSGAMIEKYGWIKITKEEVEGEMWTEWYWGNGDGTVRTNQWIKDNEKWYYATEGGYIHSGYAAEVDGKHYLFDASGALPYKTGWIKVHNKWYWGNGDGTVKKGGWIKYHGSWYYSNDLYYDCDGALLTSGIYKVDGKNYIFDNNGALVYKSGWIQLGKYWYWGEGDGTAAVNKWVIVNNEWYYLADESYEYGNSPGAAIINGTYTIGSKVYAFDGRGAMIEKKGWINLRGYWVYGNGDGTVKVSQWVQDAGKWYYFDELGDMVFDKTYIINGKEYKFDKSGVCLNP